MEEKRVGNVVPSPRKSWGEKCEMDMGEIGDGGAKVASIQEEKNGCLRELLGNQSPVQELEMEVVGVEEGWN
ncbi:unnamed protein product [Ilex paraguariensis]|uniref:Uncharacterized protein n=1 Tax=Ilex paraguariensis TaxID=185542 RepID=A0ABC8RBH7_9AQUA